MSRVHNRPISKEGELEEVIELFAYAHGMRGLSLTEVSRLAGHNNNPGWADAMRRSAFQHVTYGDLLELRRNVHKLKAGEQSEPIHMSPDEAKQRLLHWSGKSHSIGEESVPPARGRKSRAISKTKVREMCKKANELIEAGFAREDIANASGFKHWKGFYQAVFKKESTTPEKYDAFLAFYDHAMGTDEGEIAESILEEPTTQPINDSEQAVIDQATDELVRSAETLTMLSTFETVAAELKHTLWTHIEKLDSLIALEEPYMHPSINHMRDQLLEYHDRMFGKVNGQKVSES
jgi:hypothetical protein